MKKTLLTVRIAALAHESTLVRLAERHHLANARTLRCWYSKKHAKGVEPPKPPEPSAKVIKVREAGNTEKFIKESMDTFWGLQHRRKNEVRVEARHHLIALGFERGRPYETIERGSYTEPDWDRIEDIINANRDVPRVASGFVDQADYQQRLEEWLQGGKEYYLKKGNLNVEL